MFHKIRKFIDKYQSTYTFRAFVRDFYHLRRQLTSSNRPEFQMKWGNRFPILNERTEEMPFDSHYIYFTAWAIRKILEINPAHHVDISSKLYFSTNLSAIIPVQYYDYRIPKIKLDGLSTGHADLTKLDFETNSLDSLSCMHVVEHIGLGRYGDPLDADGDLKSIKELKRVLAKGGHLLFVVPVGQPKIIFNAHRIYNTVQILEYLSDFQLEEFSLVTDQSEFVRNAEFDLANRQKYGCGCFHFRKKISSSRGSDH